MAATSFGFQRTKPRPESCIARLLAPDRGTSRCVGVFRGDRLDPRVAGRDGSDRGSAHARSSGRLDSSCLCRAHGRGSTGSCVRNQAHESGCRPRPPTGSEGLSKAPLHKRAVRNDIRLMSDPEPCCQTGEVVVREVFLDTSKLSLSAASSRSAEVLPKTSVRVALWMQNFRTWVFRSIKLKDHPLWVRNSGIRRRVQELDFVV